MADINTIADQLSTLTVLEAAQLAKLLEEKWGVSAAAPELFERAAHVLSNGSTGRSSSREQELEKKVSALEARLTKKDEVIAEISREYVSLRKEPGEP